MSMLDNDPPGCPLAAMAVISTASSLLFLAIAPKSEDCSSVMAAAEKFRKGASASGMPSLLTNEFKIFDPLSNLPRHKTTVMMQDILTL
jgi:hypothetical protein